MRKPLIFALIVIACVALDIALHAATAGFLPLPADFEGSVLVRRFGFGPVALAWAMIAFSGMALVFLAIERRMTGSGLGKGLRYGIALGLVVQVAMIEGVAMFGNSLVDEFVVGLSDAVPVVVMGALLGRFLASEGPPAQVGESVPGKITVTLTLFALIFGTGRLGVQLAGLVDTAARPGRSPGNVMTAGRARRGHGRIRTISSPDFSKITVKARRLPQKAFFPVTAGRPRATPASPLPEDRQ